MNKKHSSSYFRIGNCYEKMGKYEEALKEYYKCKEIIGNDESLSTCIGICLYELKKKDEALDEFKKVLKINENNKIALKYKSMISNNIDINDKENKFPRRSIRRSG